MSAPTEMGPNHGIICDRGKCASGVVPYQAPRHDGGVFFSPRPVPRVPEPRLDRFLIPQHVLDLPVQHVTANEIAMLRRLKGLK